MSTTTNVLLAILTIGLPNHGPGIQAAPSRPGPSSPASALPMGNQEKSGWRSIRRSNHPDQGKRIAPGGVRSWAVFRVIFRPDTGVVMMGAADALAVIRALEGGSIDVWLSDGGWGVDALLGEQTRPHKDVDLIVRVDQAHDLVAVLHPLGFTVTEGRLSSCFVLRDQDGRTVDVHPVVFDQHGNDNYTMKNGEVWVYAAAWFDGSGTIQGQTVRCLTAEAQVLCHTGYVLDEQDRQDMAAL